MKDQLLSLFDIEKNDLFKMHSWLIDQDYIDVIPFSTHIFLQMSYCYKKTKNKQDYMHDMNECIEELINKSEREKDLAKILNTMISLDRKKFFRF